MSWHFENRGEDHPDCHSIVCMDTLFLSHASALQYWRAVRAGLVGPPRKVETPPAREAIAKRSLDAHRAALWMLETGTIDASYFRREDYRALKGLRMHLYNDALRARFLQIDADVYIASPELCFLQLARTEAVLPLAELAMELCGSYSLYEQATRGFVSAAPLCSLEQLKCFVSGCGGSKGAKRARAALAIATGGSASPRETELYLMLSLPLRRGGWGLRRPELAYRIELSDLDRSMSGDRRYIADLCWPEEGVIVEYDGRADHSLPEDVIRDKSRRSMLNAKGYKVIVFTADDVRDDEALGRRAAQLAHALGMRSKLVLSREAREKQSRLRRHLFWVGHHRLSSATTPLSLPPSP